MKRGRPIGSQIRKNVIDILYHMGKGYGYEIYAVYRKVFRPVTLRSIYYHLKKGVQTGELRIDRTELAKGNYSWGSNAEKKYYMLGPNARSTGSEKVRNYLQKR